MFRIVGGEDDIREGGYALGTLVGGAGVRPAGTTAMQLGVKSDVGAAVNGTVEADQHETVRELRDRIATDQAINASNISLVHNGEVLSPGDSLKKAGLRDGDTVRVLPADREGGSTPSSSFSPRANRRRLSNESKRVRAKGLPISPLNPRHYRGTLIGKALWQDQTYPIDIRLPPNYPHSPPIVRLRELPDPPHPNFAPNGGVCVALLDETRWTSEYNIATLYRNIQNLFEDPNWRDSFYGPLYKTRLLFALWKCKEGFKRVRR